MDTFMDKLAQKLTAQEMIKANTAADAEEMKRIKNQLKEYEAILDQMKFLVADAKDKLEHAQVDGDEINRLVAEGIVKINEMQADTEAIEQMQDAMDELEQNLAEKMDNANESIHKECVKVYRNVQAAVVEENGKQTEVLRGSIHRTRGKIEVVLGISVAALVVSVAGLAFQILLYLNIL